MSAARQKRISCEACRKRKLKCSGKQSGCSRCVRLGLACEFRDRGMPGRPRKWPTVESLEHQAQQSSQQMELHEHQDAQLNLSADLPEQSSTGTSVSTDYLSALSGDWSSPQGHSSVAGNEQPPALSLLDFDTSENLYSLSLDPFRACLTPRAHQRSQEEQSPSTGSITLNNSREPCCCAQQVFETLRLLQRDTASHGTMPLLRQATNLLDKLLVCSICYDVSKPPRITLQNVLLLGRLFLGVTTSYHEYLEWVKDYCQALADRGTSDKVYLPTNTDATSSMLGFEIAGDKLFDLIAHGLQADAKRLSDLGARFAIRQHNRHLIGHESCPDAQGRCWKEKADFDPDPSDVCPQSAAARTLTPCYRIVDEVNSHIKRFKEALM
jgi:hypothetical protein